MEEDIIKLLKIIKLSAQTILESGGEIYRAEETIKYICKAFNMKEVDSIATPTGIYITVSSDGTNNQTVIKRIKKRNIDLEKLNNVINISRQLTSHKISLDSAISSLEELQSVKETKDKFSIFYVGISAAFFTLMFGGTIFEFFIALLSGLIVSLITKSFENLDSYNFFSSIVSGAIIALFAILSTYLSNQGNYSNIIVGGIMPHLPGLSMTNAIRDTIRGDLISGLARATEALLIAASLAAGTGLIISISYALNLLS